jgi:hypothetical protein
MYWCVFDVMMLFYIPLNLTWYLYILYCGAEKGEVRPRTGREGPQRDAIPRTVQPKASRSTD